MMTLMLVTRADTGLFSEQLTQIVSFFRKQVPE